MKRPSLNDVAKLAGVGVSTASRVLNGRGEAGEQTQNRIREAAEKLGYYPSALGRSLVTGRSGTIGILSNSAGSSYPGRVVLGVAVAAAKHRWGTFLHDLDMDPLSDAHIRSLQAGRVDGLVIIGVPESPHVAVTERFSVPVVYAYTPPIPDTHGVSRASDIIVQPDQQGAGRLAVQAFASVGRQRIAHVTGNGAMAVQRAGGLADEAHARGLELVGPVHYGDWTSRHGYDATRELLQDRDGFDALWCGSDVIARGCLAALREAGVAIPEDVAVLGYDNIDRPVLGAPFLATIEPHLDVVGTRALECLAQILDDPDSVIENTLIAPELVNGPSLVGFVDEADRARYIPYG